MDAAPRAIQSEELEEAGLCRTRAGELRMKAARASGGNNRIMLLETADTYDRMAYALEMVHQSKLLLNHSEGLLAI